MRTTQEAFYSSDFSFGLPGFTSFVFIRVTDSNHCWEQDLLRQCFLHSYWETTNPSGTSRVTLKACCCSLPLSLPVPGTTAASTCPCAPPPPNISLQPPWLTGPSASRSHKSKRFLTEKKVTRVELTPRFCHTDDTLIMVFLTKVDKKCVFIFHHQNDAMQYRVYNVWVHTGPQWMKFEIKEACRSYSLNDISQNKNNPDVVCVPHYELLGCFATFPSVLTIRLLV